MVEEELCVALCQMKKRGDMKGKVHAPCDKLKNIVFLFLLMETAFKLENEKQVLSWNPHCAFQAHKTGFVLVTSKQRSHNIVRQGEAKIHTGRRHMHLIY